MKPGRARDAVVVGLLAYLIGITLWMLAAGDFRPEVLTLYGLQFAGIFGLIFGRELTSGIRRS